MSEVLFGFRGVSLVGELVEGGDAVGCIGGGVDCAVGEGAGLVDGEGAVHEEERLLGDGGLEALGAGGIGVGEVEGAEHPGEILSVDEAIDGTARAGLVGGDIDGEAAVGGIEVSGDGEESISEGFEVEALAVEAAEVVIIGVGGECGGVVWFGGLLEGLGEDDGAVEGFDGPVFGDELGGEVIEQVLLEGFGSTDTEVTGGGDERSAEVPGPDSIDDDAGGEGVVGVGDGLGEFESAAAMGEGGGVGAGEGGEEAARDFIAGVIGVAAEEDAGVGGGGFVLEDHGAGGCAGVGPGEGFDSLAVAYCEVADVAAEEAFDSGAGWCGGVVGGLEEGEEAGVGCFRAGVERLVEGGGERFCGEAFDLGELLCDGGVTGQGGGGGGVGVLEEGVEDDGGEGGGVGVGVGGVEVIDPALEDDGGELAWAGEIFEVGWRVGDVAVIESSEEVGAGLLAEFVELVIDFALADIVDFLFDGLAVLEVALVLGVGVVERFEEGFFLGFFRGGEDAVEGVVVFLGDGVEFVVVAAGAGDREAESAAGDDINAVVDDVILVIEEAPAEREEAHGGEGSFIVGEVELVGGDLFDEELVIGFVVFEGLDDVVAVGIGVGVAAFFLEDVAFGIGVAGDIEPVAGPAFAVAGGVEELFDGGGVVFGGGVLEEGVDLLGGGGEAGEVIVEPAEERARVGWGCGLGLGGFEFSEDELVDGVGGPVLVLDWGRVGLGEGLEGPVVLGGGLGCGGE